MMRSLTTCILNLFILLVIFHCSPSVSLSSANALASQSFNLHMMWTTSVFTLGLRHLTVLQSYLFFHPQARLHLYVLDWQPSVWSTLLQPLLCRGYQVELIRIDNDLLKELTHLDSPCALASDWIANDTVRRGPYYYSHLTDFLRFCILLRGERGKIGVYSDFDAILLKPFPSYWLDPLLDEGGRQSGQPQWELIIGKDRVKEPCTWCWGRGDTYLAPGVMIAKTGAKVLARALQAFTLDHYDPNNFNAVGPRAITEAAWKDDKILVLNQKTFYPVDYLEAFKLFTRQNEAETGTDSATHYSARNMANVMNTLPNNPLLTSRNNSNLISFTTNNSGNNNIAVRLNKIQRVATSLHFFGSKTNHLSIQQGSIMEALQNRFIGTEESGLNVPSYLVIKDNECLYLDSVTWQGIYPVQINMSVNTGNLTRTSCGDQVDSSVAELNICLHKVEYCPTFQGVTYITFQWHSRHNPQSSQTVLPIYNLPQLLTILVKTMDRMSKVFDLVTSLRHYYGSRLPVIVANDGKDAHKESLGMKRGFYYLPLPFDVGLSAARNILVSQATNELVFIVDDDFIFTEDSDLGYLVHQVMAEQVEIAAAKSPTDMIVHGLDYSGLMRKEGETLLIESGHRGQVGNTSTCLLVDIVPNLMVARRATLLQIGWDNTLKLGEHEDFFWRATHEHGVKVATCPSVALLHNQDPHWKNRTDYDRMRNRVWTFLQIALEKHGWKRLVAFNKIIMALLPIQIEAIQNLRLDDLQPFSAHLHWSTWHPYHLYKVDVWDITDLPDEHPGILLLTQDITQEISGSSPYTTRGKRQSSLAMSCSTNILGLDPDRYYRLVVRPGNYTHINEEGPEIIIKTPPYHGVHNLIFNGDFSGNDKWWQKLITTHFGLVPVEEKTKILGKKNGDEYEQSIEETVPARSGHFARGQLSLPGGDYAASLYVGGGKKETGVGAIYQIIPAGELPSECFRLPCQVSLSGWCRVDRIYGEKPQVQLIIRMIWSDGQEREFRENFDPEERGKWQCLAFSTGLNLQNRPSGVELVRLELWAVLRASHGAVVFDDFYLAVRSILGDGTI